MKRKTGSLVSRKCFSSRPGSRYSNTKSVIDSGKAASKVEILSNRFVSKRKGELFQRISPAALSELMQTSPVKKCENSEFRPQSPNQNYFHSEYVFSPIEAETTENTFIIIDFREYSEYLDCHIQQAVSFPSLNLIQDKIHPLMFRLKNQEGKSIVVYTREEKTGIEVAQKLAQRNFYNVFLLSGGLLEFSKKFPELVDGEVPLLSKTMQSTQLKRFLGNNR